MVLLSLTVKRCLVSHPETCLAVGGHRFEKFLKQLIMTHICVSRYAAPLVAVVIITTAKEENRQNNINCDKVCTGRRYRADGWVKQIQETGACLMQVTLNDT